MAACVPAGTGTLPAATYSSAGTAKIACDGVTDGLTLTVGPDATIGTESGPVSGYAIDIDGANTGTASRSGGDAGDSPGDKDITVVNGGRIYASKTSGGVRGVEIFRDGAGLAKVEHKAGAEITVKGSRGRGISIHHNGKQSATSKGVHVVSAGDIDLSGTFCLIDAWSCFGIIASTGVFAAEPLTIAPITVEVTGTINADSNGNYSNGVYMNQFSSGTITFTNSGTIKSVNSAVRAISRHKTPVKIMNRGTLESAYAGIWAEAKAVQGHENTGDFTITATKDSMIKSDSAGIVVDIAAGTGDIVVTHGGIIEAGAGGRGARSSLPSWRSGIYASSAGTGSIAVTATKDSVIKTALHDGIWARITNSGSDGTVTVSNSGSIDAAQNGIWARITGSGSDGTVTVSNSGSIDAAQNGIDAQNFGTGDVMVTTGAGSSIVSEGTADKATVGIGAGIRVSVRGADRTGKITVSHSGRISSKGQGIHAAFIGSNPPGTANHFETSTVDRDAGSGTIKVETAAGSEVAAEKNGIRVWHHGGGLFDITVGGRVTGGGGTGLEAEYAGVHIAVAKNIISAEGPAGGGGTVTVLPEGHVSSNSGIAVRVDPYAGPVKLILRQDKDGFVGHIDGKILNPGKDGKSAGRAELTFHTRMDTDGQLKTLAADSEAGVVYRRIGASGVYASIRREKLTTLAEGQGQGYEFVDTDPMLRLYSSRARLYEALPSVLLGLNARFGSGDAARDGNGGWVKVFMSDGERMAESSTTAAGWRGHALGWDMKRRGLEIGYDFPADETLSVGFSAWRRTAEAAVMRGGGIKAEATGGTVTLGWLLGGGVHAGWHLSYSRLNGIELSPMGNAAVIEAAGGTGISTGAAVGMQMEFQGMMIKPRAGLEWSSVKTGGFAEPAEVEGAGDVPDVTAKSLKGTLGTRIDMAAGEAGAFWAAVDLDHDFKDKTSIAVPGDVLKAEMKPTWGRLGLGGEFRLSDMMTMSGNAYYAAAGGGNKDVGGSLALNVRF